MDRQKYLVSVLNISNFSFIPIEKQLDTTHHVGSFGYLLNTDYIVQ